MNKRLLIAISLIVLILALAGGILFLVNRPSKNSPPPAPVETPLSGFPVSPPVVNEAPVDVSSSTPITPINLFPPPINISGLTKLAPTAVAGAVLLPRVSSTTPSTLIYLEESTGNLFRVAIDGQNNQQLTINSLPGVARAWWGVARNKKDDTLVLLAQSLNHQQALTTFRGAYNLKATSTEPTDLIGAAIPDVSAGGIAVSPNRDRFFSLTNTPTGLPDGKAGVSGTVTDLFTGKIRTIFTSRLKSWVVNWPSASIITLVPRASAEAPGTLYFLNPETGVLTRVLGEKFGLTALVNQSGTKVLYGQGLGALAVYSTRDGDTRVLTIATLPEKCVWASDVVTLYCAVPNSPSITNQYPDDWWRGEVAFNDSFWQVDANTGEAKIIFTNNSTGGNNNLDAVNLILNETGKQLIFTDRWSATLWSLELR
ncbi:MAG: hypothetical protein V1704_02210 [Candidatus Vogelbacteria bacterium]